MKAKNLKNDAATLLFLAVVAAFFYFFLKGTFSESFKEQFSFKDYWTRIKDFLAYVWVHKSLGMTPLGATFESEITRFFLRSFKVIGMAFLIAFPLGIWKGFFDASAKGKAAPLFGSGTTWFLSSLPDFFVVICLQIVILYHLPFIPLFGQDRTFSFIIPSLFVALYPILYIARITAASIQNQKGELYVTVARAKGLSEWIVLTRHIFRNCIESVFGHFSSIMLYVLSNLLIVEWLFDYKGAAYRLFLALDEKNQLRLVSGEATEPVGLVLGFMGLFLALMFGAHLIEKIVLFIYQTEKKSRNFVEDLLKMTVAYPAAFVILALLIFVSKY